VDDVGTAVIPGVADWGVPAAGDSGRRAVHGVRNTESMH
jgi:hypothetical protein